MPIFVNLLLSVGLAFYAGRLWERGKLERGRTLWTGLFIGAAMFHAVASIGQVVDRAW